MARPLGNPWGLLCFLRAWTPTRCLTADKVPGGNPNPTSALEATAWASQLPEGPTSTLTGPEGRGSLGPHWSPPWSKG